MRAKGTAAAAVAGASASVQGKKRLHKDYFLAVLCSGIWALESKNTHTNMQEGQKTQFNFFVILLLLFFLTGCCCITTSHFLLLLLLLLLLLMYRPITRKRERERERERERQ